MYYYYAFNIPTCDPGFPVAALPAYPFACFENWSLSPHEDSKPIKPQKMPKETHESPQYPQGLVSLSSAQNGSRKHAILEEDGSDAFTQKRNIIPNNINHILAYVQRKSKSERIINRIIGRLQAVHPPPSCPFSARRFYAYQTYLKGKIDIHVSKKTLVLVASNLDLHSDIFSPEEQLFYNRVCRAAISHYLRNVAALTTLNSRRLRETSKKDHLCAQRHLLHFMKNIEDQQILQI